MYITNVYYSHVTVFPRKMKKRIDNVTNHNFHDYIYERDKIIFNKNC